MNLSRRTARFGTLPDVLSFNCSECNEWHVAEEDPLLIEMPGENSTNVRELKAGVGLTTCRSIGLFGGWK
jgi:hypothetical protein